MWALHEGAFGRVRGEAGSLRLCKLCTVLPLPSEKIEIPQAALEGLHLEIRCAKSLYVMVLVCACHKIRFCMLITCVLII